MSTFNPPMQRRNIPEPSKMVRSRHAGYHIDGKDLPDTNAPPDFDKEDVKDVLIDAFGLYHLGTLWRT